jgi:hypothetical protein
MGLLDQVRAAREADAIYAILSQTCAPRAA